MSQLSSSTSFQGLFNAALEIYEKETGTKLVEHPLAKQLETCNSAESITIILEEQAQKFRKFRRNDGKIMKFLKSSVDVLYPLFNSTTVTGLIGLVPFPPANAIFTGIAVLLAAIKDIGASYDKLIVIFSSFESFLSRLSIYIGVPPTPALTNILVKTIQELLSVLALATKEVKKGRFKRVMKKVRGENSEKDIEAALQRLDRLNLNEGLATGAQTLQAVNKAERDNVRQKIWKWLSPPDPWKNHNIVHDTRHSRTGTWLIQGDTYATWKSSGPSSLLWINGKPGAGKSVICSAVIEDIRALQKSGRSSLAFFYCDFREDQKRDRRGLLSSLLVQLGEQSDVYSTKLSGFYGDHGCGSQHASDDELLDCLKDMLKQPEKSTVHIIIDALDECPTTTGSPHPREKVLNVVKELVDLKIFNLRICVTSRPEDDIESFLGSLNFRSISLERENGQVEDIAEYVKNFVNTDSKMQGWENTLKQMVIDELSKKANGMFRWVYCQLDYLRRCTPRTKDIRRALDGLPKTLDETYAHTLEGIDEQKWEDAHRIFQCVAAASRPLSVGELAQFLAFDYEAEPMPRFLADWRPEDPTRAVLSTCSSLLAVVKPEGYRSPIVQFAHFSAQEYLMSPRLSKEQETRAISHFHFSMTQAHTFVAQACLGLLLHLDETVTKDSLKKNFPLVKYAAQYWVAHARIEDVSSKVQDGMKRMFDPGKSHFFIWVWIYDPDCWFLKTKRFIKTGATPLYCAAFYGMHDVAKFLIVERSQDVNARHSNNLTPLHAALSHRHLDIAHLLIEHGADGNAWDDYSYTPLYLSLDYGYEEVARILLEKGADAKPPGKGDTSSWTSESARGDVEVARLLLKRVADANTQNNHGLTALHVASAFGRVGIARVLLEHHDGVDVNARGEGHSTPLHLASGGSSNLEERLNVVRLLVHCGSDIHARDDKGRTPFMIATEKGHHEIMQVLLECGAEDHRK